MLSKMGPSVPYWRVLLLERSSLLWICGSDVKYVARYSDYKAADDLLLEECGPRVGARAGCGWGDTRDVAVKVPERFVGVEMKRRFLRAQEAKSDAQFEKALPRR